MEPDVVGEALFSLLSPGNSKRCAITTTPTRINVLWFEPGFKAPDFFDGLPVEQQYFPKPLHDDNFVYWQGICLPKHERDLWAWITPRMIHHPDEKIQGRASYQLHKYRKALSYVKDPSVALDIGAHCGLWSMAISQDFKEIYAYEPVGLHCQAFIHNVNPIAGSCKINLHQMALGNETGCISMDIPHGASGNGKLSLGGDIVMDKLDNLNIPPADFVKIDVDGYEGEVIKGGLNYLKEHKPVIIIECKEGWQERYGNKEADSINLLIQLGYKVKEEINGDFIMMAE